MKQLLFIPATILFCIVFSTASLAQTVPIKGGLKLEFPVTGGKIVVHLPNDIRPGEMISGTVVAKPSGDTEEEISSNSKLMQKQKYKLDAGGITVTNISTQYQPLKYKMAEANFSVTLTDNKNNTINSIPVSALNSIPQPPGPLSVPTHALTIGPLRITGPFDGDKSTTKCRFDGKETEVLAESPRQIIVFMPQMAIGEHTVTIEEQGITTKKKIQAVDMTFTSPKTDLIQGEKTSLTIEITGLQKLPSDAKLVITNLSSAVVTLTGGNSQSFTITPEQVKTDGVFKATFYAQSIINGKFDVNADLQLPESGQSIITSLEITLPAPTPAGTAAWSNAPPPFTITAQATLVNGRVTDNVNGKILAFIRNDSFSICGTYTQQTAPPSNFTTATKTWSGQEALALLGQECTLSPGRYQLCVQLYGPATIPTTGFGGPGVLLKEACKPFTIDTIKKIYSPPVNEFPANEKVFTNEDSAKPGTFKWLPVSPKPTEDVVYKIKVNEMKPGMSATEASRTGKTLFEREVRNETQLVFDGNITDAWPVGADSKYLWNVQATGSSGKDYGQSQYSSFAFEGFGPCRRSLKCLIPSFSFCKTNDDKYKITTPQFIHSGTCLSTAVTKYTVDNLAPQIYTTPDIIVSLQPGQHTIVFRLFSMATIPGVQTLIDSCIVTVNIFSLMNATINPNFICNGEAATATIPPLPNGYSVKWEYQDGTGPWTETTMSGSPSNTNSIYVVCPPAPTTGPNIFSRVTRTYRPIITGTPEWLPGCIQSIPLSVFCRTVAGRINGAQNFCLPSPSTTLQLTYEGGNWNSISWAVVPPGQGQIISSIGVSATVAIPQTPGTFTYTASVKNGSCPAISRSVTITTEKPIKAELICNKQIVCPNDSAALTIIPLEPLPPGVKISWEYRINCEGDWLPAIGASGLTQNTNNIGNLGPYSPPPTTSICWRAVISSGTGICPDLKPEKRIDIIQPPCCPVISKQNPNAKNPKCANTGLMLVATFPPPPICDTTGLKWTWYCNGVAVQAQGLSFNAITPGTYKIVVSNKCGATCTPNPFIVTDCNNSLTIDTVVCSKPKISLDLRLCAKLTSTGPPCKWTGTPVYNWSDDIRSWAPTTNPCIYVNPTHTTKYTVRVSGMGCPPSTLEAAITIKVCN